MQAGSFLCFATALCQGRLQSVDLLLAVAAGRFQLGGSSFQPLLLCLGTHFVVGGGDLFTGRGGQLCLKGIYLLFAAVGLFLRGKAVLLQFCSLYPQLFHLLLAGKEARRPLNAAAGEAAARVDDLTVQRDHLVVVAQLPGHTGGFVDVVHHHDAAQQIRHDVTHSGGRP